MSRVDQALRRAAEDGTRLGETIHSPISGVAVAGDVAELAQEPFPVEAKAPPIAPAEIVEAPPPTPPVAMPVERKSNEDRSEGSLLHHVDAQLAGKIVVDENTSPVSRVQYRRLAAALHRSRDLTGVRVVMITSAAVGEGKTLTAANLALTLSLPKGAYRVEWIDVLSGNALKAERVKSADEVTLISPDWSGEIALRIRR